MARLEGRHAATNENSRQARSATQTDNPAQNGSRWQDDPLQNLEIKKFPRHKRALWKDIRDWETVQNMSPRRALDFLEWTRRVGTGIFHLHRNSVFKTVDLSLISHLPLGLVPLLKQSSRHPADKAQPCLAYRVQNCPVGGEEPRRR